jgi:hypothetical protein
VQVNRSAQSDGLAQAAMRAVARIATANGHPLQAPPEAGGVLPASHKSTKPKGGPPAVLFILPPLAVVVIALLAGRLMSRRREGTAPDS